MTVLVTGGAGFIGSALVREMLARGTAVVNVDCLGYASNLAALGDAASSPLYVFERGDIRDRAFLERVFADHAPDAVMHLAAESHVDRSIDGPAAFIETNLVGTYHLLEAARGYWSGLAADRRKAFRFLHVSTDEVFGELADGAAPFSERTPYAPRSPYAATKAGSDHLVRAWHHTFGLPVLVTNCSNNYGPWQFPEKLIPHMILNALRGRPLPVYGDGMQVRDWLYVDDHVYALLCVLEAGSVGETYTVGGCNEQRNLAVVEKICGLLEELAADRKGAAGVAHFRDLITFVADRPGHDRRYAIDAGRIGRELGWRPRESFDSGLAKTVSWYLANERWWKAVTLERRGL